jgi:prophage antirepressor-like protein
VKFCHDFRECREGIKEDKMEKNIAVFRGKGIRKIIHKNEWWFSVSDVVEVLTDSADPRQYIKKFGSAIRS